MNEFYHIIQHAQAITFIVSRSVAEELAADFHAGVGFPLGAGLRCPAELLSCGTQHTGDRLAVASARLRSAQRVLFPEHFCVVACKASVAALRRAVSC